MTDKCYCRPGYRRIPGYSVCIEEDVCTCDYNETFNMCASPCEKTCRDPNPQMCTTKCERRCECNKGYIRDTISGQCVKLANCPADACPLNERWNSCIDSAEPICPELNISLQSVGLTPGLAPGGAIPTELCQGSGCVCKDGFVRHESKCILADTCPKSEMLCLKANEEWQTNGYSCGLQCSWPKPECADDIETQPGCYCKDNFARDVNGDCKPESECCTASFQEYSQCAPSCHPTCNNPTPSCDKKCNLGCRCKTGYILDNNHRCIKFEECPITDLGNYNNYYIILLNRIKQLNCN